MILDQRGNYIIPVTSESTCKLNDSTFDPVMFFPILGCQSRKFRIYRVEWVEWFRSGQNVCVTSLNIHFCGHFSRHISGSHFCRPTHLLRSVEKTGDEWCHLNRGSPKVVSQDSLDVIQRGQPAQLHWKDFFTLPLPPICKKKWLILRGKTTTVMVPFPASHLGLPEGVSYIFIHFSMKSYRKRTGYLRAISTCCWQNPAPAAVKRNIPWLTMFSPVVNRIFSHQP